MRFSIGTLLFVVVLVALYFPIRTAYLPFLSNRLKKSHPGYQDFAISSTLREGDSFQVVSGNYQAMRKIEKDDPIYSHFEHVARINNWIIESSDEFYEYTFNGQDVVGYHQFRNGQLVNHPIESFNDPYENSVTNNLEIPNAIFRAGEWPLYFLLIILLTSIWLTCKKELAHFQGKRNNAG